MKVLVLSFLVACSLAIASQSAEFKPCFADVASEKIAAMKADVLRQEEDAFLDEDVVTGRDKGFNTAIDWKSFTEGMALSKSSNKPALVLLHKSWCPVCANLKKEFNNAPARLDIIKHSKDFVMINAEDDEVPQHDPAYAPDGVYIPRILFVQPDGKIRQDITNPAYKSQWKYFYPLAAHVAAGMKMAKAAMPTATSPAA
mmetsp:Transcript_7092/g.13424  ORF Transcript_7092/g.13424 Transcript_7092/m.13424 type:complete len:200 (-) Transcript_7092:333-932(-)|eukprot:CAMPEP_0175152126 /NCGR_PEP_ID=MMETSP0087-20121206/18926_1 /TAXON_ID=136419 /ORGANISM="Unknown Unknown, Strain D1" /LENGTH=199 /DNA_ID=CAMNT_0016438495 /DNA_START=39 /DNA_END=638 /DNA_ORIENTATION=-